MKLVLLLLSSLDDILTNFLPIEIKVFMNSSSGASLGALHKHSKSLLNIYL
jgi:hypothetical protein